MHGTNVDPMNPHGRRDPRAIKQAGFDLVRLVPRNNPILIDYCLQTVQAGLQLAYVWTPDGLGWEPSDQVRNAINLQAQLPAPYVQIVGNEPDGGYVPGHPDGNSTDVRAPRAPSSWVMSRSDWVTLHQTLGGYFYGAGYLVSTAGMCSGHPSWTGNAYSELQYHFAGVHPYDKDAEGARSLLQEYQVRLHSAGTVCVPEWNRPADQIVPFIDMLNEETAWDAWFCESDGMVNGFGRLDLNGNLKPEGMVLRDTLAIQPPAQSVDHFQLGFKKFAEALPNAIGGPVQAEFNTGYHGWQAQATTKGILSWHEGNGMVFVSHQGDVWNWPDGAPSPQRIR